MSDENELWCPRRQEGGPAWPGPDTWRDETSLANADPAATPTCSFCGSLAPERFLELTARGWIVDAVKNYKAYLGRPATAEELDEKRAAWMRGSLACAIREVELAGGKSEQEIEELLGVRWDRTWRQHVESVPSAKFYFQHLSTEQRVTFIELCNSRRMRLAGGGFAVVPYFCRAG